MMESKLARQIGVEVAVIVVGSAMVPAGHLAWTGSSESTRAFLQYFWTVGALGAFTYLYLLIRFRERIVRPLSEISNHVEDMSMGIFQRWEYPVFQSELDETATMMNHVADQNNNLQDSWRTLSFTIAHHMAKLRGCEDLPEDLRGDLEETWNELRKIDDSIMGVFSPLPQFSMPRLIPDLATAEVFLEPGKSAIPTRRKKMKGKDPRQATAIPWREDVVTTPFGLPQA